MENSDTAVKQKKQKTESVKKFKWKSSGLRLWNELATLCLVSIVFLAVVKNELDWIKGTVGFFGVAIGLMVLIKLYKRTRKNYSI